MKDEIKYEVQSASDHPIKWWTMCVFHRKKDAKDAMRDLILADLQHGLTLKYRILKLTIKKEVVK
jgi:hypothetical protein